ncbi:MAG: bile acid:sodium symporter [Parasphingorhabdus sp.]|uniref:bile acid:sodium symporter family protein n=1 Tax=Parasphingorhabdus sp. TaxID=2709688 RepID=UPI00329871EF
MGAFYIANEYWFAVFQLVLAMLGMGATLTPKDFREILVEPKAVTSGSAIQLLLVPLIAFLFIQGFSIAGGVAVGIALIAAIPGGTTSNIFTHFARGNVALSVTITALTTIACLVTTPLILELLIAQYMPDDFVMPRQAIMTEIALTLLLPLTIGMAYLRFFPKSAATFSKWCVRGTLLGILMIVIGSSLSGRLDINQFGPSNLLLILLLILVLAVASWLVGRGLGLSTADATAIDMEVVVRNVNLGLMLKASLFPAIVGKPDALGDMVLFSLLAYGVMQMLIAAVIIIWNRKKIRKLAVL